MRIKVADTAQYVSFVAFDSDDHISRKTGLSAFTVYYFLNNGAATAMTTPTINEKDATNMKGVYNLLIDEAGMVSAKGELTIHITATGMDDVTRVVEITDNFEKDIYDIANNETYGNSALNTDLDSILTDTGTTLDALIKRVLGLTQENYYIDNTTFETGKLKTARIRIYSVAGSVGSASDVLATYNIAITYDANGNMETYKVTKA